MLFVSLEFSGRSSTNRRQAALKRSSPEMKSSSLRILYLEDEAKDAELVQAILAVEGIEAEITRVETEAGFPALLQQGGFGLILADYTLPSFDSLSALKIAQHHRPLLPLIFVSG